MKNQRQITTWNPAPLLVASLALFASCSTESTGGQDPVDPDPPIPDPEELTFSGPNFNAGIDGVLLTWETNLATTAQVEVFQAGSSLATYNIALATTSHQFQVQGLAADADYSFRILAAAGTQTLDSGLTPFRTLPAPGFVSDDFFANNLNRSVWNYFDPMGGGRMRMLAGQTGEGLLQLEVPAGSNSSAWLNLNATRVTQPVPDEDQTLEVVFTGALDQEATGKGLVFEQDTANFARFDFAFNNNKFQLFAAVFQNGSLQNMEFSNLQTGPWLGGSPLGMRVTRTGNQFLQEYTLDGTNWLAGPTMTSNMTVAHAGVFVASEGAPSTGVVALVDYMQSSASPILLEDGQMAADQAAPFLYNVEGTALGYDSIELAWNTDEAASAEIRYGATAAMTDGLQTESALAFAQTALLSNLLADTTYFVEVKVLDALGQSSEQVLEITTPADNSIGAPEFTIWHADNMAATPVLRFGDLGLGQAQVNVMGNVFDADEDRLVETVSLEYRLNQGPWVALAMGDDRTISYAPWRLADEGDFNLELMAADLTTGTLTGGAYIHDVLLRATDDENHVAYQPLTIEFVPNQVWNPNVTVDWTSVLNSGGDIASAAQIVDGRWRVENLAGMGAVLRTDPNHLGYDRLVAIGQGDGIDAWDSYEVELDAKILALDPEGYTTGTSSYAFGFVLRWTGHTAGGQYAQPNHNIYPFGGAFLYRWFDTQDRWEFWSGHDEGIQSLQASDISVGTHYSMKLRVESLGAGGSQYAFKMWEFGTVEPAGWTYDLTTPGTDTINAGSLLLVAHHADVAFGNIQVTEL